MAVGRHEAAAAIAAYAPEIHSIDLFEAAGAVAQGQFADPAEALDLVHRKTHNHHRLTFEDWLNRPDSSDKIEARVKVQESFVAYASLARRAASPAWCAATVMPFHRMHLGSEAFGFSIRTTDGDPAILKVPRKETSYPRRLPLSLADRAQFAEARIRELPMVPGVNFEKIIAASYTGAVITSKIVGDQLIRLSASKLARITDEHLQKALADIHSLSEAGVLLDNNGSNAVFNAQHGFGHYDPLNAESPFRYAYGCNVRGFTRGLILQGASELYIPRHTRSEQSKIIRRDLHHRLGSIALDANPQAAEIIAQLDTSQW